ncbi:hypothetical protein [Fundidesulfovibrio magnetotacticus]|nr:hypothetical protein [Fundidesulfovibrio magnetotacticus]
MADPAYDVGSNGPISMANSNGLITFDPQQVAVEKFAQRPAEPPVSVNAWTGVYDHAEKGRIIGNVVI